MQENRKKVITGIGLTLVFGGLIALNLVEKKQLYSVVIIGSIIAIGFFLLLFIYLQEGFAFLIPKPDNRIEVEGNNNRIYQIQGNLDTISPEILDLIKNDHPEAKYFEIIEHTYQFKNRIKKHISSLSRNSNLNLLLGLFITSIAVALLLNLVYGIKKEINTYFMLISYYTPRVLIIIFIEIFAFFFLRLYRRTIEEIRYFHNELTNVEAKILSFKAALLSKDINIIKDVINNITQTERNFILKKDEKTIELEKIKMNYSNNQNISNNLTQIIENFVKEKLGNT